MFPFGKITVLRLDGYNGELSNFRFLNGSVTVDVTLIDPAGQRVILHDLAISVDWIKAAFTFGGKSPDYSEMLKSIFGTFTDILEMAKGGTK